MRKKSILFVSDSKSALALYRSSVAAAGDLEGRIHNAPIQGWMR